MDGRKEEGTKKWKSQRDLHYEWVGNRMSQFAALPYLSLCCYATSAMQVSL